MICSKCGFDLETLKDGYDGAPTCDLCMAVAKSRPGYEGAALLNAAFRELAKYFVPDETILGEGEPTKRGRGRPRKA